MRSFLCWWDSAPELLAQAGPPGVTAPPFGPFQGVTTNPMLMLQACESRSPLHHGGSGWDLYLACGARSARFLTSRQITIPFCVQVDPRSAFDAPSMLRQAGEILERIPAAMIKIPLTAAGIETMRVLAAGGIPVNATWGFSVAQLVAGALAIARSQRMPPLANAQPRYVLTIMEGRIGELGLRTHIGCAPRRLRAAECLVFEAAYASLRGFSNVAMLLASSLRPGPDGDCWHYGTKVGKDVILTLPPSFLHRQGLPSPGIEYGRADDDSRKALMENDTVLRYMAEDGFQPHEFDRLPPLIKTRQEAIRAMERFDALAQHG